MNLVVEEVGTTANSTVSQLFVDNRAFCFVIEDGYRKVKEAGETRIAPGRYQVIKANSGKFFQLYNKRWGHKWVPYLKNVPEFEGILIHIGNTPKDTRGCLLVNRCIGVNQQTMDYEGTDSTTVYKLLYALMNMAFDRGEEIWIDIQRREVLDLEENYG